MSRATATDHRSIGLLIKAGTASGVSDAELLDRFLTESRDISEAAFESLLLRHGPVVLSVCTKILGNRHDAEDAFQSTFLILATRANSIRVHRSLASWLHGVALRVATRFRANNQKRTAEERRLAELTDPEIEVRAIRSDGDFLDHEALHQEIQRLPSNYRDVIILCYLQGMTQEAAAFQLCCPPSTVGVRLMRARRHLAARLNRRGVCLVGRGVLPALPPPHALPLVRASLASSTIRLMMGTGGTLSTTAARITAEILKSIATVRWGRIATIALAATIAIVPVCFVAPSALLGMTRHQIERPAPPPALWVGQKVVTKYATPLIEEGQVVDDFVVPEIYTVQQIKGDLVRIDSSDQAGWVAASELVPLDQACEFYAREIENNPSNVEAYRRRGWLRGIFLVVYGGQSPDMNEFHQAILDLTNAIRLRPDLWYLYYERGRVFSERSFDIGRAIADYTEAIRLEPARAELYPWRAGALYELGHFDEAVADCDEAIRRDPDLGGPGEYTSRLRSDALKEKSKREKHLAELDQDIRDGSRNSNTYMWRAYYRWQTKNYGGAYADYFKATQIEPANATPRGQLARFLAACPDENMRNFELARESAIRGCDLTGWKDPEAILTLAWVCYEAGDFESAVKWQTNANELGDQPSPSVLPSPKLPPPPSYTPFLEWQSKTGELRDQPSPAVFQSPWLPLPQPWLPLPLSDSSFRVMGSK
jgi:RNA polymerase sigma factor (sigma-70 family)